MGFGDFTSLCHQAPIPLCSLLGPPNPLTNSPSIQPTCFSRSITLANTIIFQPATCFLHLIALSMTVVMLIHVRSKFTAVGRREITSFFYTYMLLTFASLVLDAGVISPGTGGYRWICAVQIGLVSALCTCLLVNGFVGFQLYEDGTTLSVWLLRLASGGMGIAGGAVALLTFQGWAGLGPENTTGLFVVMYIVSAIEVGIYLVMQVILVANTLQERWPLGHIAFGVFFLVIGQVILYVFSGAICEGVQHYLDGLFFATISNLLAVMMVYKYWDSITKEDLEFSVGTKMNNWTDTKDHLLLDPNVGASGVISSNDFDRNRGSFYEGSTDYSSSMYQQAPPVPAGGSVSKHSQGYVGVGDGSGRGRYEY